MTWQKIHFPVHPGVYFQSQRGCGVLAFFYAAQIGTKYPKREALFSYHLDIDMSPCFLPNWSHTIVIPEKGPDSQKGSQYIFLCPLLDGP